MRTLCLFLISVAICLASPTDQLKYPKEDIIPNCFKDPSGITEQESVSKLNKLFAGFLAGKRVDSLKTTYGIDTTIYKFTYNENGFTTQYIAYKAGAPYKKGEYEYNANGKILSDASMDWISSAWSNNTKNLYSYYDDGSVKTITSQTRSGSQWINLGRNTFTYNAAGLVYETIYENWISESWVYYSKTESLYNQFNDITQKISYFWRNSIWSLEIRYLYSYDSNRNNILKETYNYSGVNIIYATKDSMDYNSQNKMISLIRKKLNNNSWVNLKRDIFDYDSKGNNTIQQSESWYPSGWIKSSILYNTYNSNNLLTEKLAKIWRTTDWENSSKETYSYNAAQKMITKVFEIFYENAFAKLYSAKYTFDSSDTVLVSFHVDRWTVGSNSLGNWLMKINIDNNWLSAFEISGYDVDVYYTGVPIPVELASFTAAANNGTVLLNWETSTETNNKGFFIERKTSGNNWQVTGFVNGHGTTASKNRYSHADNCSVNGELYYRLRQVDFDGTEKLSKQVKVNIGGSFDFALMQNYPNPFNPSTTISYSIPHDSKVKISVYSLNGELVKELVNGNQSAGFYNIKFDASMLSSGVYFYFIEASDLSSNKSVKFTRKMTLIK